MSSSQSGPAKTSFWQTVPGILTAIAGVITAVATLLTVLHQVNSGPPSGPAPAVATAAGPQALTATPVAGGVSLSGDWTGQISLGGSGGPYWFGFEMNLSQQGSGLQGVTTVTVPPNANAPNLNPGDFMQATVQGTYSGATLSFNEIGFAGTNDYAANWVLKSGALQYSAPGGTGHLDGGWSGSDPNGNYFSGEIHLTK